MKMCIIHMVHRHMVHCMRIKHLWMLHNRHQAKIRISNNPVHRLYTLRCQTNIIHNHRRFRWIRPITHRSHHRRREIITMGQRKRSKKLFEASIWLRIRKYIDWYFRRKDSTCGNRLVDLHKTDDLRKSSFFYRWRTTDCTFRYYEETLKWRWYEFGQLSTN